MMMWVPESLWYFPFLDMLNKTHVRGKAVVKRILDAVIQELCDVGYGALRFERVADRAGVNRTTIYRRWSKKPDLVREALLAMHGAGTEPPATGSVRGDLTALCGRVAAFAETPEGRAVMRLFVASTDDPELRMLLAEIRRAHDAMARAVLEPLGMPTDALDTAAQMLPATLFYRIMVVEKPVDETFVSQLVDLLVRGAHTLSEASGAIG